MKMFHANCSFSCQILLFNFVSFTNFLCVSDEKLMVFMCPNIINGFRILSTVKILKIGTPEIITIIVLQLEQLDFTVQYCVQKMQTI